MCHVNLFGGGRPMLPGQRYQRWCGIQGTGTDRLMATEEGKGKGTEHWAYDDSYIIDENDQLSANWDGRNTRHVKG